MLKIEDLTQQLECALTNGNREKQLLLKIDDLTQQLECANELRIRTEQDFGNFRVNSYNFKRDLSARGNKMKEFEVATKKEIKREIKEKFKRKMEAFE